MPSDFVALQEPFGDDGIRTVNFFNGRLLTGNDMSREQAARRQADARIGLAMGDGIASGLRGRLPGEYRARRPPRRGSEARASRSIGSARPCASSSR